MHFYCSLAVYAIALNNNIKIEGDRGIKGPLLHKINHLFLIENISKLDAQEETNTAELVSAPTSKLCLLNGAVGKFMP